MVVLNEEIERLANELNDKITLVENKDNELEEINKEIDNLSYINYYINTEMMNNEDERINIINKQSDEINGVNNKINELE